MKKIFLLLTTALLIITNVGVASASTWHNGTPTILSGKTYVKYDGAKNPKKNPPLVTFARGTKSTAKVLSAQNGVYGNKTKYYRSSKYYVIQMTPKDFKANHDYNYIKIKKISTEKVKVYVGSGESSKKAGFTYWGQFTKVKELPKWRGHKIIDKGDHFYFA